MAKKSKTTETSSMFFADLIEGNDLASMLTDGLSAAEFTGTVDTGSYMLNAAFSGSLYGGVSNNKVTAFAGESSTGKTFFVLGVVKQFLDDNPRGAVVYYDTEAAVTRKMMEDRGIDVTRIIIAEPETIQAFRTHAVKLITAYTNAPIDERPPMMFVLDSLGMLPSIKEAEDIESGSDKRDMTKTQLIRGTFRVLTLKLAKAKIPFLMTQHTYEVVGAYVPTKAISGGGGVIYAASSIAMLSKTKERDGGDKSFSDIVGNVIKIRMFKSRLSVENKEIRVLLTYDKGLDRWYGLLPLAEKHGIVSKIGKKYAFPDGTTAFESQINKNGEMFWTPYMDQLEVAANKEFSYGLGAEASDNVNDLVDDGDEEELVEE
jgi:RecA/RadA recombinase